MSRTLKLVLLLALAEMTLLALGVGAWRWSHVGDLAALTEAQRGRWWTGTLGMFFFPVWVGGGSWLQARKLNQRGLVLAADSRRFTELTWMATLALAAAVQAWMAGMMLGFVPQREVGIRIVEALTGVFFMVIGNFQAKTSPPSGARAPDPAAWTRGMLRIGWLGVTAGFAILVAAIVAPIDTMIWVIFTATLSYAGAALWQRRAMHRKPA